MNEVDRRNLYIKTKAELRREGKENPSECILYLAEQLYYARQVVEVMQREIDNLNKQLEGKMEEVYPIFMRDYEIVRQELIEMTEERNELQRDLQRYR